MAPSRSQKYRISILHDFCRFTMFVIIPTIVELSMWDAPTLLRWVGLFLLLLHLRMGCRVRLPQQKQRQGAGLCGWCVWRRWVGWVRYHRGYSRENSNRQHNCERFLHSDEMHPNGRLISYWRYSTGLLHQGGSTYNRGIVFIAEVFVRLRSFVDLLFHWEHGVQWGRWLGNNIKRFPWFVECISFLCHRVGGFCLWGGVLVLRCQTFLDLVPTGSVVVLLVWDGCIWGVVFQHTLA